MAKNILRQSSRSEINPNDTKPATGQKKTDKKSSEPQLNSNPRNEQNLVNRTYKGRKVLKDSDDEDQTSSSSSDSSTQQLPASNPTFTSRSSCKQVKSQNSADTISPKNKQEEIKGSSSQPAKKVEKNIKLGLAESEAMKNAIESGRIDDVKRFLKNGTSPIHWSYEFSPLYVAARLGHMEIVELLLQNGERADKKYDSSSNPLQSAMRRNNKKIIQLLVQNNADVNFLDEAGRSPLYIAISAGDIALVTLLLRHGADVNRKLPFDDSPLSKAIQMKRKDIVLLLLKNGAAVNHEEKYRGTPLHVAVRNSQENIVSLLIKYGANLNLQKIDGMTPLCVAAENGDVKIALRLIKNGAKLNLAANDDATPLHIAADKGNIKMAALLIRRGAKINLLDEYGYSPLLNAARNGHEALVELFLQNGAKTHVNKDNKYDVLDELMVRNKRYLAKQGFLTRSRQYFSVAAIDLPNEHGETLLHSAAKQGHPVTTSLLIAAGASLKSVDLKLNTPLHLAVENRHLRTVKTLLQAGADPTLKNQGDNTALGIALWTKPQSYLVDLLLDSASTSKRKGTHSGVIDMAQLAQQASEFVMKIYSSPEHMKDFECEFFVRDLCKTLGVRHIVGKGLAEALRQMPADWPEIKHGSSYPSPAQVRMFYLYMLISAQRLHTLRNQDDIHRAAYYDAQQALPEVPRLIDFGAIQSQQLIMDSVTELGEWEQSLNRFFASLTAQTKSVIIESRLEKEIGLHPLLVKAIPTLWASLETKSPSKLIEAMHEKFNTAEFVSAVIEVGNSDALRFMLMEQLKALDRVKAQAES